MRFHLIDRIEEICRWDSITAVKCISLADDVFDEHFPSYPIFPGTLILEGLAQLGGSFFEIAMQQRGIPVKRAVLTVVREFKIKRPAGPGDRLVYRADVLSMQEEFGVVRAAATLDGEPCAAGELMFAFIAPPSERIDDKIRATREELYEIVTRHTRYTDGANRI
jgi:3-hydroxyacyl-[acyl-carrier-protein] dehydratase